VTFERFRFIVSVVTNVSTATETYHLVSAENRRNELILTHLPLVRHIIARLVAQLPPGVDVENLASAGTLGLVEAAGKFDPERGIKFETFAFARIRGAVLELRRNCPLPQHLLERIALVRKAYPKLPPPVSREALAVATGLTGAEIADCLSAMRMTRMISWENLAKSTQARLPNAGEQPDAVAELAEQKQLLAEALGTLPERERLVVTLYYLENLRLKEIGAVLDLSESRVSRLLSAALFDLGEYMRAQDM
jgi:RNA polymerase sigma factor for flagellar operon FliA